MTYSLNGVLYRLEGRSLIKAGKKKVSEGQLGLWDESAHARDEGGKFSAKGSADKAAMKIKEMDGEAADGFRKRAEHFVSEIGRMPLKKLQSLDADEHVHDNIYLDHVDHLLNGAKEGIPREHHGHVDDLDIDEHAPTLAGHLGTYTDKANEAIASRISAIEERVDGGMASEAAQKLVQWAEQLPEPTNAAEAKAHREKLKAGHASIVQSYADEISSMGGQPDWTDLDDQLSDLMDEYSEDPRHWED